MKKLILALAILSSCFLFAEEGLFFNLSNKTTLGAKLSEISEMTFSEDGTALNVATSSVSKSLTLTDVDSINFGDTQSVVSIKYDGTDAYITNPFAFNGVTIEKSGADVVVTSTNGNEVEFVLSGTSTDGSFKIYSDKKFILTLNGVNLTNADGAAINIQSSKKCTVNLTDNTTSYLTDATKYVTTSGEDMKGTFFSEGDLVFQGNGTLNVVGKKKHGICSDDKITVNSGNIIMSDVASDAIHSKDKFTMNGGYLKLAALGDGIDGDEGYIYINDGTLDITASQNTTKGIKCDSLISISGGTVKITTTGGVTVTSGDPSYCTAIKCDSIINISGGNITIVSTGEAGKGISADKDITITGGTLNISTTGNGAKYTNAANVVDSYSATCITGDTDIYLLGGNMTFSSSGTAGKCVSSDANIIIGSSTSSPVINAKTSGAKFLVSGSGNNADYANPKAIKADNNLTVENGDIYIETSTDGGEGLESKNVLTINGGNLQLFTYDDAINASNNITINGGNIYCYSSGNDGIDSNGTLTITGGVVISSGTNTPEEGFDCDQNTFKITGGILIGTGGATSTPTTNSCTQRSVVYGTTGTKGNLIHIQDASGNDILTYAIPRTYSSMTLLFSSPNLKSGTTYTVMTGGSVSGGTTSNGYTTGGTYTGGTTATTFNPTNMVTTIGNTGGGGGPGGGGRP